MHILFLAQQWAPEHGVPQRRGEWMVKTFIEAGYSVDVVAPPPHYPGGQLLSDAPEDQAGAVSHGASGETIYRSRFVPHTQSIYSRILDQAVVSASSITTGMKAINAHKPDLIIATAPPLPTAFTAYILSKRTGIPYVVDLRDAWPELVDYVVDSDAPVSDSLKGRVAKLLKTALQPAFKLAGGAFGSVLHRSAGVISTSTRHAAAVTKKYKVPTATVSNLPIVSLPRSLPESAASTTDSTAQPLHILYSGTVGRAQSLETAIEAVKLATEMGANVRLRVVGDGAHLPRIREMAEPLGGLVECRGRVPGTQMPTHYSWAHTILVSLKAWEPLKMTVPSKIFEAIGTGKHVTGSLNGEGSELIVASGAGDVVPAEDPFALAALWLELDADRTRLDTGSRGRDWLSELRTHTKPRATLLEFVERARHA